MITKALGLVLAGLAAAFIAEVVFGVHLGLARWLYNDVSRWASHIVPWH